jgi:hypothetical protein
MSSYTLKNRNVNAHDVLYTLDEFLQKSGVNPDTEGLRLKVYNYAKMRDAKIVKLHTTNSNKNKTHYSSWLLIECLRNDVIVMEDVELRQEVLDYGYADFFLKRDKNYFYHLDQIENNFITSRYFITGSFGTSSLARA